MANNTKIAPFWVGRKSVLQPYSIRIATVVALTFLLPCS